MRICSWKNGRSENESNQTVILAANSGLRNHWRESNFPAPPGSDQQRCAPRSAAREVLLSPHQRLLIVFGSRAVARQPAVAVGARERVAFSKILLAVRPRHLHQGFIATGVPRNPQRVDPRVALDVFRQPLLIRQKDVDEFDQLRMAL